MTETPEPEEKSLSPAVNRAVAILETLSEESSLGVSDIARRLDLPKSTIANLLGAMDQTGLIERNDQSYTLGRRLVEFASKYLATNSPVTMFQSGANELSCAREETIVFAELDDTEIVYLARHYGSQPIRLASDIGNRMPAVATALGLAMLSALPDDELDAVLANVPVLPQLTPNSFRTFDDLRAVLAATTERGYSIDDELNTEGVTCFSVPLPVSRESGRRYAVSVTMLKARHTPDLERRIVADLHRLVELMPTL